MSEFVTDDWKLTARTVVKLYRKDTDMLVFLLVRTIYLNLKSSIIKNFIIIRR